MCLGILLPGLVWEGLNMLLRGPPKPSNTAQALPGFKHDIVLCCLVDPHSRCTYSSVPRMKTEKNDVDNLTLKRAAFSNLPSYTSLQYSEGKN